MDISRKQAIANSFSEKYAQADLNIDLSKEEYAIFQAGIYAGSMDEKWHIFSLNDIIFFARSWTNNCIFKIFVSVDDVSIRLEKFQVTRDAEQYKGTDAAEDAILLKKLLQMYLKRSDFYVDPRLELGVIRETIQKQYPNGNYTESVGSSTVEWAIQTYNTLSSPPNDDFFNIIGWHELEEKLSKKDIKAELTTVYIQYKESGRSKTLFFNEGGDEFLGEITIEKKENIN